MYSIIMAVYNVEEYIGEAIESLTNQMLDFEQHVQVVLVNDGSTDNSEDICLKYRDMYPNNIVYIKKENGGVSSARNKGLEVAEGKYINFLDPDDKLSPNVLLRVGEFFEQYYNEIDIVTIPLHFFGSKKGEHPLNSKFKGNRVINIEEEPKSIFFSSSSSFVKASCLIGRAFDEQLHYAEDGQLMNSIVLDKKAYGIVSNAKYLYRKRENGSSAIDQSGTTKDWYIDYINQFSKRLIEDSLLRYGEVLPYIQYLVVYDLRWRIQRESLLDSNMTEEEKEEFKSLVKEVLTYIEDSIIELLPIKGWYKIFIMKLKYGNKLDNFAEIDFFNNDGILRVKDSKITNLKESVIAVQNIEVSKGIIIEGYIEIPLGSEAFEIVANINNQNIIAEKIDRIDKDIKAWDEVIHKRVGFRVKIDIEQYGFGDIKLLIKMGNYLIRPKIWIDRNVRLYSFIDKSYFVDEEYCIVFTYNSFVVLHNSLKVELGREYRFYQELKKKGKKKLGLYRWMILFLKKINHRPIWLMMDRVDRADDNAEHLFKYANNQKDGIKKYFVLDKNSSDWNRLKEIGKVIEYGSIKHKLLYILCNKMISSHTADFARHQLGGEGILLRNFASFKFIFLQHGIIKDDLSYHLNRYNTKFDIFITSAQKEYDSIVNGEYYYDDKVVKLTGLPRYDRLVNDDKKQIFIIPTWKKDAVGPVDPVTRMRIYNPNFKDSDYFKTYNALINDKQLISCAKEYGYKIMFYPHPEIYQQISDFDRNDYVQFVDKEVSYQKLLKESSLLLTDYSSIAFDFAYMKKPVLYYQWYENHYEEGYFDYETMGMGPVYEEYDQVIASMIQYIKNSCKMQEKYVKRVEQFYKYTDTDNCKRVYEEIIRR